MVHRIFKTRERCISKALVRKPPASLTAEWSRKVAVWLQPTVPCKKQDLWRSHKGFTFNKSWDIHDDCPVSRCDTNLSPIPSRGLKPHGYFP
jgi:hypothetical protein